MFSIEEGVHPAKVVAMAYQILRIFYGDLVYKFKIIVGKPNFSDQFRKIIKRYIKVG